jgi:hypothetical protein
LLIGLGCAALLSIGTARAQSPDFSCEDFITQDAAQANLERFPDDPYGLDLDGNGVACEEMPSAVTVPGTDALLGETDDHGGLQDGEVIPAPFEIIEEDFQQVARPRVVLRIVVEEGSPEEIAAAMVEALAEGLENNPRVDVARVFARSGGDSTDADRILGQAQGSRDGRGWTGDGKLSIVPFGSAPDELGMAFVVLSSDEASQSADQEIIALPLVLDQTSDERAEPSIVADALTPDELAYADRFISQTETLSSSLELGSELMLAPRIGQDDWTLQLAGVVVTWRTIQDEAQVTTPPPAFAEVHASYLLSLDYLNLASDDVLLGIDTLDVNRLDQANTNMTLAALQAEETARLINEVLGSR